MDENNEFIEQNNYEEHPHHHGKTRICNCKADWVKCLMTGLLVFLGAFMAFYTLGDLYMKTMFNPMHQMHKEMNRMDRDFMREQRRFDRDIQRNFGQDKIFNGGEQGVVNMSQTDDNYQLVIDLKPFDNNDKNVHVTSNGQTLMIEGAGITNSRSGEKMVKVSQSYVFGKNVRLRDMAKHREGNNLIITIPVDD